VLLVSAEWTQGDGVPTLDNRGCIDHNVVQRSPSIWGAASRDLFLAARESASFI